MKLIEKIKSVAGIKIMRMLALLMTALVCLAAAISPSYANDGLRDEVVFFQTDTLGSAIVALDESGNHCWTEEYSPYGDKVNNDDSAARIGCGLLGAERGYTGHTDDASTGLVYMQQRYYDPTIGRFLSVDPMAVNANDPRTFNRFSYAANNPYKYVDPDGEAIVLAFAVPSAATAAKGVAVFAVKETAAFVADRFTGGLSSYIGVGSLARKFLRNQAKNGVVKSAKEIKNARQRGVNRAKSAERNLVQNGHPGTADSGGWTFAERKHIAVTGQFPSDTRWHHINDVKRNPSLADVPDNIIPSRGGAAGHVTKYHRNGTQAGSSGTMLNRSQLNNSHMNGDL